jgi:hypothetical protein
MKRNLATHMLSRTILLLACMLPLLLSACQPIQEARATLDPAGLRPDAPEYAKHGPFWVGYKPLVIDEGTDHELQAGIWYPALNPQGAPEKVTYTFQMKDPSWPADTPQLSTDVRCLTQLLMTPRGLIPW